MKIYVEDMIVKTTKATSYVGKSFFKLRKITLNLNPKKAIMAMEAPGCKRDLKRLTTQVAALNQFISRSTVPPFLQSITKGL